MKLLVEYANKRNNYENIDGLILALKDYSVQSIEYYSVDEIAEIKKNNPNIEIFIKINKNIFNDEINDLKDKLLEIDKLGVNGIFFYDLGLIKLKDDLKLQTDLVWDQTHMVNNYMTCNYYCSKGVKYALLGKEITLEEIIEIINKSKIISMVEVVSRPSVAYSKRKLLTNYFKSINKDKKDNLEVIEKGTNTHYLIRESKNGTSFFVKDITNGTSVIKDLFDNNCEYIIMREFGIDNFDELVDDTMNYISNNCNDDEYINKYKRLGDNTNFFFKKTIYMVKKNEK